MPIVYEINVSIFKRKLKQYLLDLQEAGHHLIWETLNNWCSLIIIITIS